MIGQTISHYKILEKLGEGGMGVVYKAEDTKLKRTVALKFLPQNLNSTPEEEARFLQEAQAAATLNHPNVCTIYDIKEHDGQQFIVMECVEGATLRKKIASGPLPVENVIAYAIQIGDALQEAHQKGVIHRDVKADNIMVNAKDQIKVMDFGLAKLKGSLKLTKTSSTVGTIAYMAPEQIQGGDADIRSDMFSFGVVLFEMLAGKMPFRGEHEAAMMYSVVNEEPESISKYRSDLPSNLIQVVNRLLKKNPDDRYQNDSDMLNDLKNLKNISEVKKKPQSAEITSIAVLAFEDMSPDKDQDYLCEGLAEELINALTKIRTLHISARTSAFAFKGKQLDIREIGKKLNVQAVLEGSVRKSGNRLRIAAQLINVEDGYHLWSERYDRELKDVFEIQDEITENVVRALKVVLTDGEKASMEMGSSPKNVEAFEYYLRGRRIQHQFETTLNKAIEMFVRATEIDPHYAPAYCGIADCYAVKYLYQESTDDNLKKSEEASRKALSLKPDLAEAHASLGYAISLRKQYDEAAKEFERAIELDPTLYEGYYYYARTCYASGDYHKAAKMFKEAARVRQEDFQSLFLLSDVLRTLKDESGQQEALRHGLQRVERYLALNPNDPRAWYGGGGALIQAGQPQKGEQWILHAIELDPLNTGTKYNAACAFSNLGKIDKALDFLEDVIRNGFNHKEWIEHDSDLDPLRSHPRFQKLLASMKS